MALTPRVVKELKGEIGECWPKRDAITKGRDARELERVTVPPQRTLVA